MTIQIDSPLNNNADGDMVLVDVELAPSRRRPVLDMTLPPFRRDSVVFYLEQPAKSGLRKPWLALGLLAVVGVIVVAVPAVQDVAPSEKLMLENRRSSSQGWELCAEEGGDCQCDGVVRYGKGGKFAYKSDVSTSVECSNDVFDLAISGTKRQCHCWAQPEWELCATEGEICQCNGLVQYGAGSDHSYKHIYGQLSCSSSAFGGHVQHGADNSCFCAASR